MPGMNGTGPMGLGPLTGGGRGFCNPFNPLWGMGYPYYRPYPWLAARGWPYGPYSAGAWPYRPYYTWGAGAYPPGMWSPYRWW